MTMTRGWCKDQLMRSGRIKDSVWIGMKTQSASSSSRLPFPNFNKESPIDGCAGDIIHFFVSVVTESVRSCA
ncbi:unnamed protein product [Angiostrongylus costaricensis]|uniref:Ovule protein n=1 Tax=Angiostrongylus costaricensis TaxID=334426 RepID=A0A0R3Q267_ANGCS|nr:unnamed protein product [Angiostrongylus costaricensis]